MNEIIAADLYRHFGLKGKLGLIKGLSYPGFKYTFLFRKVSMHRRKLSERDVLQNFNEKVSI